MALTLRRSWRTRETPTQCPDFVRATLILERAFWLTWVRLYIIPFRYARIAARRASTSIVGSGHRFEKPPPLRAARSRLSALQQLVADRSGLKPGAILVVDRLSFVALREEFVEGVGWSHSRRDDQAAILDPDVHSGTGP